MSAHAAWQLGDGAAVGVTDVVGELEVEGEVVSVGVALTVYVGDVEVDGDTLVVRDMLGVTLVLRDRDGETLREGVKEPDPVSVLERLGVTVTVVLTAMSITPIGLSETRGSQLDAVLSQ